jgi:integrin alpha 7
LDNEWDHGKLLLYLADDPTLEISPTLSSAGTKIDGYCERAPQWRDHIHILDSLNRTSLPSRKRREDQNPDNTFDPKMSLAATVISPISSVTRSLLLTCDPAYQSARCYPIYCHINSLSAQSYYFIKLRARLWNSTLIEEYTNTYDRIDIQSFASISINDVLIFQTSTDNDNATVYQSFFRTKSTQKHLSVFFFTQATTPVEFANRSDKAIVPRLPLWVPLVGAMAGLILLVFIVIVCCLVGSSCYAMLLSYGSQTSTHILMPFVSLSLGRLF